MNVKKKIREEEHKERKLLFLVPCLYLHCTEQRHSTGSDLRASEMVKNQVRSTDTDISVAHNEPFRRGQPSRK